MRAASRAAASASLALVLAAGAAPASRASVKAGGAVFPDTYPAGGATLVLNGVGLRVFFHIVDGYATALYLPAPVHDVAGILAAPNPKVIYTEFLHDASVDRIRAEYDAIHRRYCATSPCTPPDDAAYADFIAHLGPVTSGETQAIVITDSGVSVMRDGKPVATIADPGFGTDLVRSLVGPAAPTESYRAGIVGKAG